MAFPVNVDSTWVNSSASYNAGELRRADEALFAGIGSALGTGGGVVRQSDTSLAVTVDASDNVTVQAGAVVIPGNAVAGTGCYRSALAASTTNALTARSAVNPRIDLIVFRQMDTDVVGAHAAYTGRIEAIAGTPSGTPSAPALPSMAVELARITVPVSGGGTATVDLSFRTYATAVGGTMVVPTSARLPAAAAKYQKAVALDTGVVHTFNGTDWDGAWRTVGASGQPAYQNSWATTPGGVAAAFRKDSAGNVHVRGQVDTGVAGTAIFTLPTGYRPSALALTMAPVNTAGDCQVSIDTSGIVSVTMKAGVLPTVWWSIHIIFPTA